jgi:hypothetical protein
VTNGATDVPATKPASSDRKVVLAADHHTVAEDSPDRPLTPGEALVKLFLDNADRGANVENDELVTSLTAALRERVRTVQALVDPHDQP